MTNKKYLFLSLVAVLICIVAVILMFSATGFIKPDEASSEIEIIWEKVSPDSQNKAIMFSLKEDTADTHYQLSIVPNSKSVTEKDTANVFSYDGIYDFEWSDERTLLIKKYDEGTDYYKVDEYNGIKIRYLSPSETREYEKNKRGEVK